MNQTKPGYVLILAVLITAFMTISIATLINRVLVFNRLTRVYKDREQARLLALSGLQIACAQLSAAHGSETNKKQSGAPASVTISPGNSPTTTSPQKGMELPKLIPLINRWQQFNFTESNDQIDGSCQIYIASEQGKIDLNSLYDFKKKQFVKEGPLDGLKICQAVAKRLGSIMNPTKFVDALQSLFKQHTQPLADVTLLFTHKEFSAFKNTVFIEPTTPLALLDIFTTHPNSTNKTSLQPCLLSQSLCTMFELTNMGNISIQKLETALKNAQSAESTAWSSRWDSTLAPLYGKKLSTIPQEFVTLFNQKFEAQAFSVISYGTFEGIVEKIYAIVYKQQGSRDKPTAYCIHTVYWI